MNEKYFDLTKGHSCCGTHSKDDHHAKDDTPHKDTSEDHKQKHNKDNAYMLKQNLATIAKDASELHDMLEDSHSVPKWADTKAAVAADKVSTLHRYLSYKSKRGHLEKSEWDGTFDLLKALGSTSANPYLAKHDVGVDETLRQYFTRRGVNVSTLMKEMESQGYSTSGFNKLLNQDAAVAHKNSP